MVNHGFHGMPPTPMMSTVPPAYSLPHAILDAANLWNKRGLGISPRPSWGAGLFFLLPFRQRLTRIERRSTAHKGHTMRRVNSKPFWRGIQGRVLLLDQRLPAA